MIRRIVLAAALLCAGAAPAPTAPGPVDANSWLPRTTAELSALDKVRAQATSLTVKVGSSAVLGSLTVAVRSCVVRPPDRAQDAAAFLDVTGSVPGEPGFHGWMLANEPALGLLEHPLYDLRVVACR